MRHRLLTLTTIVVLLGCSNSQDTAVDNEQKTTMLTADQIIREIQEETEYNDVGHMVLDFTFIDWQKTKLEWTDIPKFLEVASDRTIINDYPHNPLASQTLGNDRPAGIIALWFVEAIRKKDGKDFPCLFGYLNVGRADTAKVKGLDIHKDAYETYKSWWTEVKDLPIDEAKAINPLEDKPYYWF